ncbi:transposase domain containing protein [Nephila pilipes]|uniref:Transposase domain containing protein n=1 Tax=Nephila pilipes TaxID=299642 RepID=A0A8X6QBV2_NEPPI|nr:transposase domain containing protein [Nephila pilipes]
MGRQLRIQRPPIRNTSALRDRCLNIWYNLSPVIYQGLVASMPRRVEAVLRAKGEEIKIDEKLEIVRGRCSFIQYIPKKSAKYGIKMFVLFTQQS